MAVGAIFACARRDVLAERALAGDRRALQVLLKLAPADLPLAVLRTERDVEIRAIAQHLATVLGDRPRPIAELLAKAGDRLLQGRGLAGFEPRLTREESAEFERRLHSLLEWAPRPWPQWRQMVRICCI